MRGKSAQCGQEIKDFAEIGACGTAAVIAPVASPRGWESRRFGHDKKAGPTSSGSINAIPAIQFGKGNS